MSGDKRTNESMHKKNGSQTIRCSFKDLKVKNETKHNDARPKRGDSKKRKDSNESKSKYSVKIVQKSLLLDSSINGSKKHSKKLIDQLKSSMPAPASKHTNNSSLGSSQLNNLSSKNG